jgi:hypothetical protein
VIEELLEVRVVIIVKKINGVFFYKPLKNKDSTNFVFIIKHEGGDKDEFEIIFHKEREDLNFVIDKKDTYFEEFDSTY